MFHCSHLPPGETLESLTAYVVYRWEQVAALSYKQYLSQGRGMVVWLWDIVPEDRINNLAYIPDASLQKFGYDEKLLNIVKSYDPRENLVLGIVWNVAPERQRTFYMLMKVTGKPSPAIAYQQNFN